MKKNKSERLYKRAEELLEGKIHLSGDTSLKSLSLPAVVSFHGKTRVSEDLSSIYLKEVLEGLREYQSQQESLIEELSAEVKERMEAEKALRKSEEKLRSTLSSMDDLVFVLDKDGVFIDFYQPDLGARTFVLPEVFLGKTCQDVLPPDVAGMIESAFKEIVKTGKVQQIEYSLMAGDEEKWFQAKMSMHKDSAGNFDGVTAVVRDITKRKKAEEALQKYKILFSEINDLAYICDKEGNVQFVNKTLERLSGHKVAEIIGKPFAPLFDSENLEIALDVYARGLQGESTHCELRFKDTGVLCEYKTLPLKDENDNIIGIAGVSRDITERKKAEEELRKVKIISDKANYGIAIADLDGILLYANNEFAQMHQYSVAEFTGNHLAMCHNEEQIQRVQKLVNKLIKTGSITAEVVEHARKDGKTFPTLMNIAVINDENEKPQFLAATVIDITGHKKAEEELHLFRQFAEASSQGLGMADLDGNIIYGNPMLCQMLDADSPEKLLGTNVSSYFPEKLKSKLADVVLPTVLKTGEWTGEMPLLSPKGKLTQAIQSVFLIQNAKEEPLYFANVITDITKRTEIP
ncbi:PAS domain S-box protein [Planctomycetota bacterium]